MDICKFKGTPYYEAIVKGLISGNISVPQENFTYKDMTIGDYFSGDMIVNGEILSKADKAALLNSIQRDPEKKNILTPEIKERIDAISTQLDLSKETVVKSKVVKVPSVDTSKLNLFKIPLSKSGRLLDVSTKERGKLIPILNLELNNYVTSAILSSLKEVCLWNESKKLIIADNKELTESILMYRDSLIKVLNNFVGANVSLPISNNLSESDIEEYNNLLQSSWDAIKNILYRFNGEINVAYDENTANTLVNPIMAFYVLLNFDQVLSAFLSDFITINTGEFGNINASEEKYKRKASKRLNSSYSDDINNSDGENLLDSILDTFITSTQKSNGMYLDKKFKENLLCVLRDAVENKRVRGNEISNEQQFVNSILQILANEGVSADEKVKSLINLLSTTNSITEKLGTDSCKKLAERLLSFQDALNIKKSISTSKLWASIDNEYNVGYRLINHIANKGIVGITSITGLIGTNSITPSTKEKSKLYVRGRVTTALAETLGSNHRLLTSKNPLLLGRVSAEGITDLYSELAQDVLSKITGLNFRDETVIEKFSTEENLQKLANFLNAYREIVREMYEDLASSLVSDRNGVAEEMMKKIVISGAYIDFSDIFVEENEFELQRMFDQLGKEQARTTIATLSTQFTQCFSDFKKYIGSRPNGNILVRYPGISKQSEASFDQKGTLERTSSFAQYITFLGDCKFKDGTTVRWVKQRPNEVNTAYLNQLYLFNVLDNNMLSFLIDVTSDKMKTPLANINLLSVNFVRLNLHVLKQIKLEQLLCYYNRVKEQIFDFFERVLEVRYNTLEELDSAILSKSPDSIIEKVRELQRSGDLDFTYQPEVFFSTSNEKLQLNRSLCYEMFKCDNIALLNEYDDMVLKHYKQTLIDQGVKLNIESSYIDDLDYDQKLNLASMFFDNPGSSIKEVNDACERIKQILKTDSTFNNSDLEYFLSKFIILQNIVRESAIQIFNKHYWVHGKAAGNVSLSDLATVSSEGHKQALHDLISNEMKKRIEKSTKRNNSQSATFAPMDLGIKHGVPATIRVASILSLNKKVWNNFGNTDKLHAHDGAIWSSHILRIWERNSQTQMYMANSAKIIALQPDGAGFYQIKCADYSMTNEWIRNSISQADSNSDQFVDGRQLYKDMLSPAQTLQMMKNMQYDDTILLNLGLGLGRSNFNIFYNFQGRLAKLEDIEVSTDQNDNVVLIPTWLYTDGLDVSTEVVADTLGLSYDSYSGGLYINNLYDLWNFFGAELSQSIKEDGTIDYSDISLEYVAYLVSEYDPELKSKMISKICDPEAVKSTPFPVNSRDDVYKEGKELASVNIHTKYYGPQQDYSHETDEDTIPFTTQVIGAIAFNGQNSELVQDLYETIGQITADALAEITELSDLSNKTKLYKKIGKLVANNLSANGVISNAASVLNESLRTLVDDSEVFAKKALPLSDNQLYHAATAQILSKLNKMIKQRFAGTAVVQNPAQGIIGVYQDANGITYNKSTIINKALLWYKDSGLTGLNKTDDIVAAYLNRDTEDNQFRNRSVFGKYTDSDGIELTFNALHLLNIADNIQIEANKESLDDYKELYNALKTTSNLYVCNLEIQDPIILYQLVDAANKGLISGITKVYNRPRNLATTQITFKDVNGKYNNFWLLESTQAVIGDKTAGISENKWWHHENIKGIGDKEKPYYFATLLNFRDYFSSEEKDKEQYKTYIVKESIVYRGGEEVLPKQYKRKYSINGSMSDILELNLGYFRDLAQYRMKADPKINLDEFGKRSFAISTNDYDIIFADPGTQVGENVVLEKVGQYYRLYTEEDELIPNIKLPVNYNYSIQYVAGEKPQLVIVPNEDVSIDTKFAEALLNTVHANSARFNGETHTYAEAFSVLDESLLSLDKINLLAQLLLTSFKLTLKTVSVRIPSQSFQSFLPNETVLFNESDDNNGYMNLWEMWFQGSDYDIDKAYTIMFEPGENGVIEGNIFSDYLTPDKLLESFLIRQPDTRLRLYDVSTVKSGTKAKDVKNLLLDYLKENPTYNYIGLNKLLDSLKYQISDGSELLYTTYDESMIDNNGQLISVDKYIDLINKLNAYNFSDQNETYKKNKAMAGIRYASLDIHNLKASQVPMESGPVNASITESQKRNGTEDSNLIYLNDDPGHIAHFQYQNAIGKEGVGISANGIKVLSAVQQNVNNKIKSGTLKPITDVNTGEVGLNLEFKLNRLDGVRTLNEKVLKIPNTPMTREQFDAFYGPYQTTLPVYKLFEKLLKKSFEQLSRVHTNTLSNKERDFLKCYLLLSSETYKPTFLETLYLAELFEQNTADMMSIFISLCTDNAKELSLFKIGATPDLLNLPLAMLALGMDILDVTDICVQYIVPLLSELNVNRYTTEKQPDVKDIIQNHIKNAPAELVSTYESLLKIYNVAQEMKIIARQFKVNQGVSVITTEVQDFLNSLNKLMADKDHIIDATKVKTYADFFGPDGQKAIETAVSNYKATAINIVDIITGSANFFKQLEACYRILGVIEDNITVPHVTSTITKRILGDGIRIKSNLNKVIQQTVLNALLSEALKSLPTITFEKRDTEKFGEWGNELASNALIGISTKMKIDNLLEFVENALIPYLQLNYKDNFFTQLLRRNTSNGRYELPFNSFDAKGDLRTKMDITKATLAFTQISSIATGIHTLDGIDITFGDLMYLYSIIVNQNRINSLSTIVKEAASKTSRLNIAEKIDKYYAELDRLTSISTTNVSPNWTQTEVETYKKSIDVIEGLVQRIYPYAKALILETSVDVTLNGVKLSYQNVDEKVFPLFTMIPGELKIDAGGTYTDMPNWKEITKNTLQTLLNGHNSSAKINKESINLNGETLTFTITLPTQMGKLERKSLVTVGGIKNGLISVLDYNRAAMKISRAVATLSESLANIAENGTLVKNKALSEVINPYVSEDTLIKALKIIGYDQTARIIPTFALNLYNWFISKKYSNNNPLLVLVVTGSKYIKSHMDKLGTEPILMINPSDFSGKPLDIAYTLMNLFLDKNIDPSVIPTPLRRLVQLLISITGNNDINEENLSKYLNSKEILDKLKETSAARNWYLGYLDDTTLPQLKETAWNNLGKFTKALSVADTKGNLLYYYTCDESLDNEIGDIFEDESGSRYIYVGDTDTNFMILRNIDPESEESVRLTYKSAEELHSYKRIAKPRINSDYSNNKLLPTKQEKDLYKAVDTLDIRLGDLVTFNGKEYYISAVLYEKLPNRQYNTIVLGSSDGKTLEDITSDKYSNIKRIVSDIESTEDNNFTVDGLPNGKLSIKEILVNKMSYGNIFKYYGGNGEIITSIFKSYNRGFITTVEQKLVPIESLHSVNNFDLIKIYPKLHIDTIGLSLKVPNKESIASIIYGRPEFKYGYIWYPGSNNSGTISPRYIYNLNSEKPQFFKPFNIGGDLQYRGQVTENSRLEKNDTVLIQTLSDDQLIMSVTKYLILDSLNDSYVVLESKQINPSDVRFNSGFVEGLDRSSVQHKIITVSRNSLNGGKLYKDETRKGNIRLAENNQVLNNSYDAVYELMDYLSKRFGTPVQFVENMEDSSVFARVNNGVIEINMANKPKNMSSVYYMMQKGIHEFMHLAITALKIESPETYLQLIKEAKSLPEVALSEKYNTLTQRGEEALVNYLVNNIMDNIDPESDQVSIKNSDIKTKMLQAIKDLLKIDSLTSEDLKKTLESQLNNSGLFRDNTFISQEEMLGKTLRDKYMEQIEYVCE